LGFRLPRYYGESLPFGNETFTEPGRTRKLQWLTSAQALADFADLLRHIKVRQNSHLVTCVRRTQCVALFHALWM